MAVELSVTKCLVRLCTSLQQWDGEDYENTHNLCCRPIPRFVNIEVGSKSVEKQSWMMCVLIVDKQSSVSE